MSSRMSNRRYHATNAAQAVLKGGASATAMAPTD
jgi:hypothetical protein